MKAHTFTLILSGVAKLTPELADALYAATQGDVELNLRDGVAFLEFERTASTLREAITVAIGEVERAETVVVKGRNRHGKEVRIKSSGFTARAFQHELDHLDGVLFTDKLTSLDTLRRVEDLIGAEKEEAEAVVAASG